MPEDISYRQHRYLIMMGTRVISFAIAIIQFAGHLPWLAPIPATGAIFIPNTGRVRPHALGSRH